MDVQSLIESAAQVIALGGFLFWLGKTNARKIDDIKDDVGDITTDVAVIKSKLDRTDADHDRLIILKEKAKKFDSDISAAHAKIRSLSTSH